MKHFGNWEVDCDLSDGARLNRLRHEGVEMLTTRPQEFRPPQENYGRYETRPVYGYDDCFPTVDPCDRWPDHGELCWLRWRGSVTECFVRSELIPVTFTRRLEFGTRDLVWAFSAENQGECPVLVQHVMHPLMPLDQISALELPDAALGTRLLSLPPGKTEMLFVRSGDFALTFRAGLQLRISYDHALFPTLGIWWNNRAYPNEEGCRRCECAFERTPGVNSQLQDGTTMKLSPRGRLSWQVRWEVERCQCLNAPGCWV